MEATDDDVAWESGSDENALVHDHLISGEKDANDTLQRKARAKYTDDDHMRAINRHKDGILAVLETFLKILNWANHDLVIGALVSRIPSSIALGGERNVKCFINTMEWFRASFSLETNDIITSHSLLTSLDDFQPPRLVDSIAKRIGSSVQRCQYFLALMKALKYEARLVIAIDPCSWRPHQHRDIEAERRRTDQGPPSAHVQHDSELDKVISCVDNSKCNAGIHWIEVYMNAPRAEEETKVKDGEAVDGSLSSSAGPHGGHIEHHIDDVEVALVSATEQMHWRWVHVDINNNLLDRPESIELLRGGGNSKASQSRRKLVSYVVAMDSDGCATDVTARYSSSFHKSCKLRLPQHELGWWEDVLTRSSRSRVEGVRTGDKRPWTSTDSSYGGVEVIDCTGVVTPSAGDSSPLTKRQRRRREQRDEEERLELRRLSQQGPAAAPTSLADFKDHPRLVLERHIRSDQMVHPHEGKVQSLFRGEKVFLRQHLEQLCSKTEWRQRLRRPRDGESPAKTTRRRKGEAMVEIGLYGYWQTEVYEVPRVVDGVIPINEHGNVEVWNLELSLVPEGAALVTARGAAKVALSLGIPFAPAIVGFENKGMYTAPKIGGVVVLKEHEMIVLEGAGNVEEDLLERRESKRVASVVKRWEKLVGACLTRQMLKEKYEGGIDES